MKIFYEKSKDVITYLKGMKISTSEIRCESNSSALFKRMFVKITLLFRDYRALNENEHSLQRKGK